MTRRSHSSRSDCSWPGHLGREPVSRPLGLLVLEMVWWSLRLLAWRGRFWQSELQLFRLKCRRLLIVDQGFSLQLAQTAKDQAATRPGVLSSLIIDICFRRFTDTASNA